MPKHDSVLVRLGLNIRNRREVLDYSQETLAERAGLDATYISGIERGLRNPGIKMPQQLLDSSSVDASLANQFN